MVLHCIESLVGAAVCRIRCLRIRCLRIRCLRIRYFCIVEEGTSWTVGAAHT